MKDILKVNKNSSTLNNAVESIEKFETIESLNAIRISIASVYKNYSKLHSDVEESLKHILESYSPDDSCKHFAAIIAYVQKTKN
jgi:hypothetical protein